MRDIKMNTMLAKVEHSSASIARLFADYASFFKSKQGMFRGYKKTFVPRDGYFEDPSKMGTVKVATTVSEKMDWFNTQFKNWLNEVFSVEATNSGDAARVELKVGDTILTNKDLESVFTNIPVRSDSEVWRPTTDAEYAGREVFETEIVRGVTRTTEKEEVILKDPNLDSAHLPANYQAKTTVKSKTVETGDYTSQNFTGEWTQRERAELLRRRSDLLAAVIEALKKVNEVDAKEPNLNVDTFVDFIYKG